MQFEVLAEDPFSRHGLDLRRAWDSSKPGPSVLHKELGANRNSSKATEVPCLDCLRVAERDGFMGNRASTITAEDAGHSVTTGSLHVKRFGGTSDSDILLWGENVGTEGAATGLLAVETMTHDLVCVVGVDGDSALATETDSSERHS